jgi:peroxidase
VDSFFTEDVRSFLDSSNSSPSKDLPSTNIMRGRDHGLPSYNDARVRYGLPRKNNFNEISTNAQVVTALSQLYQSVDDIDPYVGGMAEDALGVNIVGELFYAAIVEQFMRIRAGDRFWFENDGVLTPQEKQEVKSTSILDIIARNTGLKRGEFGDLSAFLIDDYRFIYIYMYI